MNFWHKYLETCQVSNSSLIIWQIIRNIVSTVYPRAFIWNRIISKNTCSIYIELDIMFQMQPIKVRFINFANSSPIYPSLILTLLLLVWHLNNCSSSIPNVSMIRVQLLFYYWLEKFDHVSGYWNSWISGSIPKIQCKFVQCSIIIRLHAVPNSLKGQIFDFTFKLNVVQTYEFQYQFMPYEKSIHINASWPMCHVLCIK